MGGEMVHIKRDTNRPLRVKSFFEMGDGIREVGRG
jgi:hypothetical protein